MRSLFVFIIIYLTNVSLSAQITDSSKVIVPVDSIGTVNTIFTDSLKTDSIKQTQQKAFNAEYNQFWKHFQMKGDAEPLNTKECYYQFDELISTNYTGLADIFRYQPGSQIYDFLTPGYPRFVAGNNLLPHQSDIYLNGFILNDPMHGMFNTHMVSLDGLNEINDDFGITMYGYGNGINLKTKCVGSLEHPYSRIMFRQGDFGYTDLDIDFSRKLSENISVNLGGINKIYQGSSRYGFQYRAGLYSRFTDKIFSQTIINISREKLTNIISSTYPNYYYFEFRHDYNNSIYYITNPDSSEYWKFDAGYTGIRRKNEMSDDPVSAFFNRKRADQYKFGLSRKRYINDFRINAAVSGYLNKFWGSSYSGKLTDTGMNGFLQISYPMMEWMVINGNLSTGYLYGQDLSLSPSADLNFKLDKIKIKLSGSRSQRFPYRDERSLYFKQYRGNNDLNLETLTSYSAEVGYAPINNLFMNTKISNNYIADEILIDSTRFYNGSDRKFTYIELNTKYSFYKFSLELTGSLSDANIHLSPRRSFIGRLLYRDTWLNGAMIIDAVGSFHWYDTHNNLYYNPVVERLYWDDTNTDGYYYFSYKIAATVKRAQLYMAMDNPLSYDYHYINGYNEYYRRVRFGVNWVLMD